MIFFAYIGFDAVSTSGEEARTRRDLPIAIMGSLAIATALYIAVSLVAVGALPFDELAAPRRRSPTALEEGAGFDWAADIISFGALVAITSVVLTILFGQTRILFAMCRDGLMPRALRERAPADADADVDHRHVRAPDRAPGRVRPAAEIVKLVNIGTLFAFVLVNIGVIILRRTRPDLERGFRVPFVPVFPIIGALLCLYLMKYLSRERGSGS